MQNSQSQTSLPAQLGHGRCEVAAPDQHRLPRRLVPQLYTAAHLNRKRVSAAAEAEGGSRDPPPGGRRENTLTNLRVPREEGDMHVETFPCWP